MLVRIPGTQDWINPYHVSLIEDDVGEKQCSIVLISGRTIKVRECAVITAKFINASEEKG